jgi:cytochrome o ubiquinol oxidase subunit 2
VTDQRAIAGQAKRAAAHLRAASASVAGLCLASCTPAGVLDPQGPVARSERLILGDASVIMATVVLPVIAMTLGFAWWYRRGNPRAQRRPDFAYSGQVEMVVWSIPVLIVTFLGGIAWTASHDLDPARPMRKGAPPIEVDVVSLDWKWLFLYPGQGVATVDRLVIPVGTPVHFRLTSSGVMNSFLVPQLGSQIYTMAGMTTELNLQADRPGHYPGLSAQFSGDGFSDMRFTVEALPPAQFQAWAGTARSGGGKLDAAAYQTLARPGPSGQLSFGAVQPGLFDAIVAQGRRRACPPGATSC